MPGVHSVPLVDRACWSDARPSCAARTARMRSSRPWARRAPEAAACIRTRRSYRTSRTECNCADRPRTDRSGRRASPAARGDFRTASSGTPRATPSGSAFSARTRPAAGVQERAARPVSPAPFRASIDDLLARPDSLAAGTSGRSSGVILSHHVISISVPSRRSCRWRRARGRLHRRATSPCHAAPRSR